jgi:hypothetical protein
MKKLLATTAIASVAFTGISFAEMKISGEIEQTWTSSSHDLVGSKVNDASALGSEANVKFSTSKELDNGMTASGAIRMEDKGGTLAVDQKIFQLSSGNFAISAGIDHGTTIDGNVVANVGQQTEDVLGTIDSAGAGKAAFMAGNGAHDKEHISLSYKTDIGSFNVNYSPSVNESSNGANSVDDSGGSATEMVFAGNLGVDGLTVKFGQQTTEKDDNETDDYETDQTMIGALYNFGQVSVAGTLRDYDDGNASADGLESAQSLSVAFAANDQLSVSLEMTTVEKEGSGAAASDADSQLLGVSYNLGGLGVEAYYGKTENIGNNSANGDGEVFQLRSVLAF